MNGFRFGGLAAGIKQSGKPDLALLLADEDVPAAAVFTRNRVKAAPVLLSQRRVRAGRARGVIVNAGNANACTGAAGREAAARMAEIAARAAGVSASRVLVASTGVIGVPLPVEKIEAAADRLVAATQHDGFEAFSRAILTTDQGPKIARAEVTLGAARARLLACAKGAGMIGPNMATTLGFVVTDANLAPGALREALRGAAARTFNEVSVDGDTSTNDTLFALASGRAGGKVIDGGARAKAFAAALEDVLMQLALQIVGDGEGATHVVTIEVNGARTDADARAAARRVAASPLVKTALFGADPNWGRVLCAVGNAGIRFDPDRVDLAIGDVTLVRGGVAVPGADAGAHEVMKRREYPIRVELHAGRGRGRHVTCDLGHQYVTINADYRT